MSALFTLGLLPLQLFCFSHQMIYFLIYDKMPPKYIEDSELNS